MTTAPKTALQEIAVHSGKALPVYSSDYEGPDHDRSYSATCTYDDRVTKSSTSCKTKKAAEASAAQAFLDQLDRTCEQSLVTNHSCDDCTTRYCGERLCMVDLDNFDIPSRLLTQPNVTFILFKSKTCTKPDAHYKSSGNCMILVAPCVGKDATDIYMTYESYCIRATFPDADIAVVTRDHFGATLSHLMRATYVCNDADLINWLVYRASSAS